MLEKVVNEVNVINCRLWFFMFLIENINLVFYICKVEVRLIN